MTPSEARSYVNDAIDTETGKQAIRKAFPDDAKRIISTKGAAITDAEIVKVAAEIRTVIAQSYNL